MIWTSLRTAGWIFAGIVGIGAALYLFLYAVNWRDRPPSPATVRFTELYRDRPVVADDDNAFIYMMGFEAPPGRSPTEMGLARLAWLEAPRPDGQLNLAGDPLHGRRDRMAARPADVQAFLKACVSGGSRCASAFDAGGDAFEQWMESEGTLLERYRAILTLTGWRESEFDLMAPMPPYSHVIEGQKLLLLQARALAAAGDGAGARALLQDDLRFWRGMLGSADILISKMIAASAISRHFELGNLVLRTLPTAGQADAVPEQWRRAISDAERSMLRCMTGEWIFVSDMLRDTPLVYVVNDWRWAGNRVTKRLLAPLYQPQDSINQFAKHYAWVVETISVPMDRYGIAVAQVNGLAQQGAGGSFPFRSAYNIAGQMLDGPESMDFASYAYRIGDIEGVRRAALAAATLRDKAVSADDVAAALAASPLRDPYTNRALSWDEEEGAIVFSGLESGPRRRHLIFY